MKKRLDGHDEEALESVRRESQDLLTLISPEIVRSDAVASSQTAKESLKSKVI